MPTPSGRLTDADMKKVEDWLEHRWPSKNKCPLCTMETLRIEPHLTATPLSGHHELIMTQAYPFVLVLCENCGHTIFFNAVTLGLAEGTEESDG